MRGGTLEGSALSWSGIPGDRQFGFLQINSFSWLSARDFPELLLYSPQFENPSNLRSSLIVTTPAGKTLALDSAELIEEIQDRSRKRLKLEKIERRPAEPSNYVSLISVSSVNVLVQGLHNTVEVERFRPNIVIGPLTLPPYHEEAHLNRSIALGDLQNSARLRIVRRNVRCSLVNLDPQTATPNPRILETVIATRGNLLGVYGVPEQIGFIQLGQGLFF
jgi:uncharacterized protein YcbX